MKRIAVIFFAIIILMSTTVRGAYTGQSVYNSMEKAFLWIDENASPLGDGDSVESDYYVMAMSRANRTFDYDKYKKITRSKTPETIGDAHRIIMSNAACDGVFNETFVAECTYKNNFTDSSDLSGAVLALCSGEYEFKSDESAIDDMVAGLLVNQAQNGSFGDVVTTCKSIIALSFFEGKIYQVKGEYKTEIYYYDVNNAILRAVSYLQSVKDTECGYGDIKTTAYVIMALDSAGVDCDNDHGFTQNEKSTLGWLLQRQNEDGSFGENKDDTALAVCALVSHIRAMQGKSGFFELRSYDRIDSPDIYTEDINLSGTGLNRSENATPVEVILKNPATSTEKPTEEPIEEVIGQQIREVEKDMDEGGESPVLPAIILTAAVSFVSVVIIIFIFWRMGFLKELFKKRK